MTPDAAATAAMRRAMARRMRQIEAARTDPNAYIEFVGQTPSGARYRQAPFHRELQEQFSRDRSVTHASVYTGKTQGVMHRLVWETGQNPNVTINYVSATTEHPTDVLHAWQSEITDNPRVRTVFPHLKKGDTWKATKSNVQRTSREVSPTFKVVGAFSKSLLGKRAKITVFDDLCNFENTFTAYARDKMAKWIGEALSRGEKDNRVIFIGHIWTDDDQLCREARKQGVSYRRYEATEPDRADGTVAWQTTKEKTAFEDALQERLDEHGNPTPIAPDTLDIVTLRKREIDLGAILAMMMLRNRVPSMAMGRFSQGGFEKCLHRGRGLDFMPGEYARGMQCFTGVDLGHTKKPGADWTVLFTIARMPNGDRHVIDIRSGRWNGPEIVHQLRLVQSDFDAQIFVENNGGQQFILDFARETNVMAVRPHHTGRNKHDLVHGVESLATEIDQARWVLPCSENEVPVEEVGKFIKGCMLYDPSRPAEHTDDWLMAAWIAREGMRSSLVDGLDEGGVWLPGVSDLHGLYDR